MGFFEKFKKPKTTAIPATEQRGNIPTTNPSKLNKVARVGLAAGMLAGGTIDTATPPTDAPTNEQPTKEFTVSNPHKATQKYTKKHGISYTVKTPDGQTETKYADTSNVPVWSHPNKQPAPHKKSTSEPWTNPDTGKIYKKPDNSMEKTVDQNIIDTEMEKIIKNGLKPNYQTPADIPMGPTADNPENTRQEPVTKKQDNHPFSPGDGTIDWGKLTPTPKQEEKPLSEYSMPKIKEFPKKKEEPLVASNDTHTLDLTDQLNEPGANSYNTGDKKFGMPESTPLQGEQQNNQNKKEIGDGQTAPNQQQSPDKKPTPDKPSSPEEESPEPTNPPERLDVDGPTAIAKNERVSTEIPAKVSEAIGTIQKYLPKLTKTQMTAILTSILTGLTAIQETQAAGTLNHQDINNNQTEHTLNNTKESHDQAVRSLYFQWLKEYEEHMFDEKPLTKEKFVEDYNNTHPNANISVAELDEFAYKLSLNKEKNFNGKIRPKKTPPRTNEMDAMLGNLSTVKAPGKGGINKIGIGQNYGLSNTPAYSTPPSQPKKPYTTDKFGGRHYSSKYNDVTISPGTYEGGIAVEPE